MQTGLLALDGAGVAGEEAGLLQLAALLRVVLVEGAGDGQAQGAGLAGRAAAVDVGGDVELVLALEQDQRVLDLLLVQLVREVILDVAAVAGDLAGAGGDVDARDGALAAADGLDRAIQDGGLGGDGLVALDLGGLIDERVADGGGEVLGGGLGRSLDVVVGGLGVLDLGLVGVLGVGHCATALIS